MIGIDLLKIKRASKIKRGDFKYWKKFYTAGEWNYGFGSANTAARLAGILAAKEAIIKALGGKYLGRFDLIEIKHLANGKPVAIIKGRKNKIHISVSHEKEYAVAIALCLKN